jgi:membrane-associated phospholipid phosphatase
MTISTNPLARRTGIALFLGAVSAVAIGATAVNAGPSRIAMWLDKSAAPANRPAANGAKLSAIAVDRNAWWATGGPAYRWNEIILEEMQQAFVVLPLAARHLALFHATLDDAVASARQHKAASGASEYAAVAEAAGVVLAYLFPARADHVAALSSEAIKARTAVKGESAERIAAGREHGRRVAATAIERGKGDGSDAKWSGAVPQGPGHWKGTSPIAPLAGTWQTWVLSSPSEFRPPAPPAFDSEQAKAALAELKGFARTPRTNHRATYWEVNGGARAHALWNEIARAKLLESGMSERHGARVLAALNIALADAGTACWDAKYAYWYIRPPQLDAELKSLFPPPNHPSYPAAHGCYSTAAATVLASVFPHDRGLLLALGKEAAEARMWAGIHFRFDIEAGQELGRKVGERVLSRVLAARTN